MNMNLFAAANRARSEAEEGFNHPLESWSASDWMTATLGELGEAANIVKKLNRVRDGIPGNTETAEELEAKLADEIADTFIYLDLTAQRLGIRLSDAVRRKFDRTSAKIGYPHRLSGDDLDLQVRYDVLRREIQRERAEGKAIQADNATIMRSFNTVEAENTAPRHALGLCVRGAPDAEPATPRSMEA